MSARKKSPATYQKSKKKAVSPKKGNKKTPILQCTLSFVKANKLIATLALIVLLLLGALINQKYQDWDNAQMIKGLARDFPALVAEIESATGIDLEIRKDCMTTQEKFSYGVKTCEITFLTETNTPVSNEEISIVYRTVVGSRFFSLNEEEQTELGSRFKYRNKNSCSVLKDKAVYGTCVISIRDANFDLAQEFFSQ